MIIFLQDFVQNFNMLFSWNIMEVFNVYFLLIKNNLYSFPLGTSSSATSSLSSEIFFNQLSIFLQQFLIDLYHTDYISYEFIFFVSNVFDWELLLQNDCSQNIPLDPEKELNLLSTVYSISTFVYWFEFLVATFSIVVVALMSGLPSIIIFYLPEFLYFLLVLFVFMQFVYYTESGWEEDKVGYISINPAADSSFYLFVFTFVMLLWQSCFVVPYTVIGPISFVLQLLSHFILAVQDILQTIIPLLAAPFINVLNNLWNLVNMFSNYGQIMLFAMFTNYKFSLLFNAWEVTKTVLLFKFFVTFCFLFLFYHAISYCKHARIQYYEYPFFFAFLLIASWSVLSAKSYLLVYMLLELQGLCLILIISVSTRLTQSLQTALRYALINIIGSLFFLYGIIRYLLLSNNSIIYTHLLNLVSNFGHVNAYFSNHNFEKLLMSVFSLNNNYKTDQPLRFDLYNFDSLALFNNYWTKTHYTGFEDFWYFKNYLKSKLSYSYYTEMSWIFNNFNYSVEDLASYTSWSVVPFIFLSLGLCIKLGVGPFAVWVPGIYAGMGLLSLMVFATVPKFIYTYLLVYLVSTNRLLFLVNDMQWFFYLMAIFSLVIGTIGLFKEKYNLYRFVGWSTVVNFSLIMLALGFLLKDVTTKTNVFIYLFVIYYILSLLFFLGAFNFLHFGKISKTFSMFTDVQLLVRNRELYPITFVFIGSLFSFFGLPPFMGFWSKLYLLKGMFEYTTQMFEFVLIMSFFLGILIGGATYIKLFNIIAVERHKDHTSLSLLPVNQFKLKVYMITFVQLQVFSFLFLFVGIGLVPLI